MKIDEETIRHLEALSRIDLTEEERLRLTEQLARIVEYVEQLQAIDTDDIEPTSAVVHEGQPALRPDEIRAGLERDVVLGQAPDCEDSFFRVPKIVER